MESNELPFIYQLFIWFGVGLIGALGFEFFRRLAKTKAGKKVVESKGYNQATKEIKVHWTIKLVILLVLMIIVTIIIANQPDQSL